MSFVWKRPDGRLKSPEQCAREILEVALAQGKDTFAAVLATMCVAQESDFWCPWNAKDPSSKNYAFDSESNDGRSVGYAQQQNGRPGDTLPDGDRDNWWGPMASRMDLKRSIGVFLSRLQKNYRDAINNPAQASEFISNVQSPRTDLRGAYAKHWDRAWALVNAAAGGQQPVPAPARVPYGLPPGSNSGGYGGSGVRFPDWVYQLGDAFGVKPSTYPGHQETDRIEAGYERNPQHLNRAIDWAAPGAPDEIDRLTRFADYLATIPQELEQVIWQNPRTMRSIEVAGGRHQPGYFASDLAGHRDHVHTRQSHSIPAPGAAPPAPVPAGRPFGANRNGNVLWLADALRAEGLNVVEYPGWREKSNDNNFGEISGVIMHHTGANNTPASSIFNGRPDLSGPLSQIHLARDGTVTVIAAGCANHAGTGALSWLPKGTGNRRTIGIEAQNDGGGSPGKPHRSSWPDVQYNAYVRVVKVILWETGWGADRVASHQEYDKGDPPTFEGKWDPGAIDMNIFRADVAAALQTPPTSGDDMALVPQDQWDRVYRELTKLFPSRSPLRHLGEGPVDTMAGFVLNCDGSQHVEIVKLLASLGHPPSLSLLQEVANADPNLYPDRQSDRLIAQAILADLNSAAPVAEQARALAPVPSVVYVDRPAPEPHPVANTPQGLGDVVKTVVDAVEQLKLSDALSAQDYATLDASIKILQMKNGSQ